MTFWSASQVKKIKMTMFYLVIISWHGFSQTLVDENSDNNIIVDPDTKNQHNKTNWLNKNLV